MNTHIYNPKSTTGYTATCGSIFKGKSGLGRFASERLWHWLDSMLRRDNPKLDYVCWNFFFVIKDQDHVISDSRSPEEAKYKAMTGMT